jgi:hypothetical protein
MQHIESQPADDAAERTTTRRAGGRLAACAVGMVAAFFGVAASAFAGSVNTDQFRKSGASSDTVQAKFRAYDGENNEVKISRTYSDEPHFRNYEWIKFRDRVPFHAWWGWLGSHGCDHGQRSAGAGYTYDPLIALCGHERRTEGPGVATGPGFDELKLDLGDKNDRLQAPTYAVGRDEPLSPTWRIEVEGKEGNDDIFLGVDRAGGDSADCGPGTDWGFGDKADTLNNCENMSLGDVTSDSPAVVSRGQDKLDVFVRGLNNTLLTRSFDGAGGGWSGWEEVPGGLQLTSAPAAVRWQGQIDVFARGPGPDHALWHTWKENGTWSGRWERLGGVLTSAPTVASWRPGRLDVFVRGSDLRLHQRYCDIKLSGNSVCDGSDWSPWQQPAVGGGDLGSAAAAVSWGKGRIDVFTRGTDSQAYHVTFTARFRPDGPDSPYTDTYDGGTWGPGWVPLGG